MNIFKFQEAYYEISSEANIRRFVGKEKTKLFTKFAIHLLKEGT